MKRHLTAEYLADMQSLTADLEEYSDRLGPEPIGVEAMVEALEALQKACADLLSKETPKAAPLMIQIEMIDQAEPLARTSHIYLASDSSLSHWFSPDVLQTFQHPEFVKYEVVIGTTINRVTRM